ncbi:hypothetical protein QFC22_001650 [Naganishia vaughanmartiniae]|uniref:Uncharacterized protein n=1 Tax=Naganishia vaughanmartiniae TaxID=1424756 RepID=A0ACC2XGR0_9TREE|nr:hypothetical protein QFC22_001650 [Naganishia vaughanmartiniae]
MKMSLPPSCRVLTSYTASAFPAVFPFSHRDLIPHDNAPASEFYAYSRLVNHIDDHAIQNLQRFYGQVLPSNVSAGKSTTMAKVLDICSSWVSHIPYATDSQPSISPRNKVVGIGMNAKELEANEILSHWIVHDLDKEPDFRQAVQQAHKGTTYAAIQKLQGSTAGKEGVSAEGPYDAVICNVSIDYLSRPLEVMEHVGRNLKPGGWAYMAISNRCFPTKVMVVRPWLNLSTTDRLHLVASYFHFAGTPYNSTDQASSKTVAATLKRLRDGMGVGFIFGTDGQAQGNSTTPRTVEGSGMQAGQLFEGIQSLVIVEEDNVEGHDPLWIVRAKRKAAAYDS